MSKTNLLLFLGVAALAGCSSNGDDDDGGSGTDGGGVDPGGMRPPITATGASTLAGWSMPGYLDGNRQVNLFNNPVNVVYGPDDKVYVADFDNSKLRVVDLNGNAATVISKQSFSRPFGLAFIGNTLYVSTDRDCNGMHDPEGSGLQLKGALWKIDTNAKSATCLQDNLGRPRGIAALDDGRLAIADYAHHDIRIYDPATNTITTLAGTRDLKGFADGVGTGAVFDTPYALAQRNDGKLVVTDYGNHRIRLVSLDGTVTTLGGSTAGFADGGMSGAKFNHPQGMAITSNGDLIVTDQDNYRIRRISADGATITTVAGNGSGGVKDSENATDAQFYGLEGVGVSPDGKTIVVADGNRGEDMQYNRIRIIKL
jgi:DNA-binding beta-propeller fold protein YncE